MHSELRILLSSRNLLWNVRTLPFFIFHIPQETSESSLPCVFQPSQYPAFSIAVFFWRTHAPTQSDQASEKNRRCETGWICNVFSIPLFYLWRYPHRAAWDCWRKTCWPTKHKKNILFLRQFLLQKKGLKPWKNVLFPAVWQIFDNIPPESCTVLINSRARNFLHGLFTM